MKYWLERIGAIILLLLVVLILALPGMCDGIPRDNSSRFEHSEPYDPGY
ncbi:MAG: hypothetical protein NXI08_07270 [bacterium]|nr:hypothetical protein [bacterium]